MARGELQASGVGAPHRVTNFGGVTLQGQTDASYDNNFTVSNAKTKPAKGCSGCDDSDCIQVKGALISTFKVSTTVTLPKVSDYPDLTPCQKTRVANAIQSVLAPHEQKHVAAFRKYNGQINTPFNLKLCRSDFDSRMQQMHDDLESTRRSKAQGASDALDPFSFNVDLDCQEPAPKKKKK